MFQVGSLGDGYMQGTWLPFVSIPPSMIFFFNERRHSNRASLFVGLQFVVCIENIKGSVGSP